MSIKKDEKFLSLLGWLLEKRRKLTIAQTGINEKNIRWLTEEEEKYLNKLLEYLDDNYLRINKKSMWATVYSWLTKDKRC